MERRTQFDIGYLLFVLIALLLRARPACRSSRSRARSSSRCSSASARRESGICSSRRARRLPRSSSSTSSTRSGARAPRAAFGGHDEKEQTLNQLLVELDGFDPSTGLVLLAATNRPEILDPALLRAGRFDRQVLVDRPDKLGRIQILRVHSKKIKLSDVDLEQVAALTPGFTGADLANLINEAALLATRRGAEAVSMRDFNEAVERIVAGLEKRNRVLNATERRVVAHHELGHALVAMAPPGTDPVHKISIIPEHRFLMTREELENRWRCCSGISRRTRTTTCPRSPTSRAAW
jgi:hypothetical protein